MIHNSNILYMYFCYIAEMSINHIDHIVHGHVYGEMIVHKI